MTPEVTTEVSTVIEKVIKRKLFDLEKFEQVAKEGKISFTPAKSMTEFLARIENDEATALKVANAGLMRLAVQDARKALGGENLVSPKAVSIFVNQFRPNFPLTADTKEAKKAQTAAVWKWIKDQPELLKAMKLVIAATAQVSDDEDEDETADE